MEVTVYRKSFYTNRLRDYHIYCDQKWVGDIAQNSFLKFEANENAKIVSKIDWCRSNKILLINTTSNEMQIEVSPSAKGWRVIFILYFLTFGMHQYLTLKVVQ